MNTRQALKPQMALLFSVCSMAIVLSVQADTFVVTNTLNEGPGSFRQAILDASSNPGSDAVTFSNVFGQIILLSALPAMGDITINGPGAHQLTISCAGSASGTPRQPGIVIPSSATTTISGLRLTRQYDSYESLSGGIISNAGTLFLETCELMESGITSLVLEPASRGAAIYSAGNLFISACTIANNTANSSGFHDPAICSGAFGAGLYIASGSVSITNSTFSGNIATSYLQCMGQGGAIYLETGNLRLVNCTIANNSAADGGAIYNSGGVVTLLNTIVTDSTVGVLDSGGKNLLTNATVARLGPLQDNGGPTITHALLGDSPAIDQGTSVGAPVTDQRGVTRPQGRRVDIGAFELEGVPFSFQLDLTANGNGTVSRNPALLIFPPNATVAVSAVADEDFAFTDWSGDGAGNASPLLVTMDRDKSIVANFRYAPDTVTNVPGSTNFVVNINSWGPGSFRQAARDLTASGGGTIVFSNVTGTIPLPLGLPAFTANARICGPGPSNLVLKFPYGSEAFAFNAGVTGSISDLTIQSAYSTNRPGGAILTAGGLLLQRVHILNCGSVTNGGAVFNAGTLHAHDCVFAENHALSGGAIYNSGDLLLTSSVFVENGCTTHAGNLAQPNYNGETGGGAFFNAVGTATIEDCTFSLNRAWGLGDGSAALGGAIYVAGGRIAITDTLISSNSTRGGFGSRDFIGHISGSGGSAAGAGIYIRDGMLGLTNCTVSANKGVAGDSYSASRFVGGGGAGYGGGVCIVTGAVRAVNCTFSGNEVQGGNSGGGGYGMVPGGGVAGFGGAVFNDRGAMALTNCTITENRAFGGTYGGVFGTNYGRGLGGGIYLNTLEPSGIVTLVNTIVAGNTGANAGTNGIVASDGSGSVLSLGHNLVGTTSGFSNFVASDLLNVNPQLGPLQDNGGVTPTHALLATSPAIDAGAPSVQSLDQRGQPRSIDNPAIPNRLGSDGTDIGAIEVDHVLRMIGVTRVATNAHVGFTTVSDKTYSLEYSPEVTTPSWTSLPDEIPGTGGIVTVTNFGVGLSPSLFYRALQRSP